MKLLLAAMVLLLFGCAAPPPSAPGTGDGAQYAPFVDMRNVDAREYAGDLAYCRRSGAAALDRPERVIMNCMTGRGYLTLDHAPVPSSTLSVPTSARSVSAPLAAEQDGAPRAAGVLDQRGPLPLDASVDPASMRRLGGRDLVQAERYARARHCRDMPHPLLVAKGPGFETYGIACANGETLTVRCEFGNCSELRQ
ncbi:MAG: hypothetical protein ABI343_08765 [Burkholderiaceae bacterium]